MATKEKKTPRTGLYMKLQKLRSYYIDDPISVRLLDDKELELRAALDEETIREFPAMITALKSGEEQINTINALLTNDKGMTDVERNRLIGERDAHEFWLERFQSRKASEIKDNLERFLDEKLKAIGLT